MAGIAIERSGENLSPGLRYIRPGRRIEQRSDRAHRIRFEADHRTDRLPADQLVRRREALADQSCGAVRPRAVALESKSAARSPGGMVGGGEGGSIPFCKEPRSSELSEDAAGGDLHGARRSTRGPDHAPVRRLTRRRVDFHLRPRAPAVDALEPGDVAVHPVFGSGRAARVQRADFLQRRSRGGHLDHFSRGRNCALPRGSRRGSRRGKRSRPVPLLHGCRRLCRRPGDRMLH